MLTKRKHSFTSHHHLQASTHSSYDHDSWEEQAFAEDAAGPLGGCIWPPRSYSCSFCRREFRSAQALGGHMNVHRKDKARLKKSPPLPQDDQNLHNNPFQIPDTSSTLGFQYPNSQICTLVYCSNPNSDLPIVPSSPSKGSTNFDAKNFFPSFSSPKKDKEVSPSSSPSYYHIGSDQTSELGLKNSEILESGSRPQVLSDIGEEEDGIPLKRRRTCTTTSIPVFVKTNSVDRHRIRPEVFEIGTCSKEELDLELRLGDPPKVK